MAVRPEVAAFVALGPLPSSSDADEVSIARHQALLSRIKAPVTDEEAHSLAGAFGPDDCFGLAWTLLHLIETAPSPAVRQQPPDDANEWILTLWQRWRRSETV